MRGAYTTDVKDLLKEFLGINVNKKDGQNSESLLKRIKLTQNQRGKVNGAEFDGVKIIVREKEGLRCSTNKDFKSKVDEFKSLVEKAKEERSGTAVGFAEESVPDVMAFGPVDDNHAESIVNDSIERLDEEISNRSDQIIPLLTENEIREFRGILDVKLPTLVEQREGGITVEDRLEALKIEENNCRDRANQVQNDPQKSVLYESIADVAKLKADELRLRANIRPESKIAQNIVREETENNDLTRFEKFKQWAKRNLGGISVVAISVAEIITTIVMGARTVIKKGASVTSKFAKFLGKIAEKAGPVLGAFLNLVPGLLKLGAKAVSFLPENLWILAVVVTYALYDQA